MIVKKCMEANLMVISSVFNFVLAAMFEQKKAETLFGLVFSPREECPLKKF
jgi:hypothetical protein